MRPNLNHQKIRIPERQPPVCRLCGCHFDDDIEGICPSQVLRFAAPRLLEYETWVRLDELRNGAVFETRDGIRAIKSEYHYDSGACQCVLLESGEYAHFPEKNATLVQEVFVL